MFFNSFIFFIFLALVLPPFFLLRERRAKAILLLAASYLFYGYWDWRFCGLLLLSTVVDFIVGARLHRSDDPARRKSWLMLSLAVNLGILGFFKYCNFFIASVQETAASLGTQVDFLHLNVILPVGISFYTFQTLSYTIDIYRRRLEPTHSLLDFALFVSFFPQLVAGPIERARKLLPQIATLGSPTALQVRQGLVLLSVGYFKKVVIGDSAGRIVDHVFGQDHLYQSPELLGALILFSIQIYADFSGYSAIARGLAKLLGIELMKNFEQPYLSGNITEFWRRWHISLSSWLKDYLYISLGGNRGGNLKTYRNLMLTMLLGGLWHGAAWTFVAWGGLHGLYLAGHKALLRGARPAERYEGRGIPDFLRYLAGLAVTNLLVLLAWLFFRADSFGQAFSILERMVRWQGSELGVRFLMISLTFTAATLLIDYFEYRTRSHTWLLSLRSDAAAAGICTAAMAVVLLSMMMNRPMPFVYFQF